MPYPAKVEIWDADLRGSFGHEQKEIRPALVWHSLNHVNMALIIPLTSTAERIHLPYCYRVVPSVSNNLTKESVALLFQLRSIDKGRLIRKKGELEKHDIEDIARLLAEMLKIQK